MNTHETARSGHRVGSDRPGNRGQFILATVTAAALLGAGATGATAALKYPLTAAGVRAEAKAMGSCLTQLSASDGAHTTFRATATFTGDKHPAVVAGALYPGALIYGALYSSPKAASVPVAHTVPPPAGASGGTFGGATGNVRFFWKGTQNVNSVNDFMQCVDRVAFE